MATNLFPVIVLLLFNFVVPVVKSREPMRILKEPIEENCDGFTCVRKCCPADMYVNITFCSRATDKNFLWNPVFHYDSTFDISPEPPRNLKYLYGIIPCDAFPLRPSVEPGDTFYLIQEDGRLHVPLYKTYYGPDKYCVDNFATDVDVVEEMALLCFEEEGNEQPNKICTEIKTYLYPLLLMVSCVFLTITLFVYICIPELHGKLHGRCLMSLVSSLLVAYIFVFVVAIASGEMYTTACLVCATARHFTLLASFFWLNVLSFDIWRSLRLMRPSTGVRSTSGKRFCLYSLYAWGSSFIIATVAIIIDTREEPLKDIIRPNYLNSRRSCWFEGTKPHWYYFYTIVAILLVVNLFFFVHVIYIILKSQNSKTLQEARSQNRDRLWLYGKLFLVMGISWIFEIISWQQGTCEAWIITDIVNALQGFIIFLVFVCKKSTRQLVSQGLSRTMSIRRPSKSAVSGSTRLTFSSTLRNGAKRDVSNLPESHRLMERGETPTQIPVTIVQEENTNNDVNDIQNGQHYLPEKEEDCPSIHGDSEEESGSSQEKSSFTDQDIKEERVKDQTQVQSINTENTESAPNISETRDLPVENEQMSVESKPIHTEKTLPIVNEDKLNSNEERLSTSASEESLPLMTRVNQEEKSSFEKP